MLVQGIANSTFVDGDELASNEVRGVMGASEIRARPWVLLGRRQGPLECFESWQDKIIFGTAGTVC